MKRTDKRIMVFAFSVLVILFFAGSIYSYDVSSFLSGIIPQTTKTTSIFDQSMCKTGQDFIIQISPLGCTPAVVRSDLLEENDVPVYCQLSATKVNPLITVKAIDSISFSGQYPEGVSGIGFHPAKAALGINTELESSFMENIGYVVINLKKHADASSIPDYVSGNLTASVKYGADNAFGIGNALFYLPQLSDIDWSSQKNQYSFWGGKGYLKADYISNENAEISVYSANNRVSGITLKKGETSGDIFFPGFECEAGLKLKLEDLSNPDTYAKIRVNAEVTNVAKGNKFLDNKCEVRSISKRGIIQTVSIGCKEDSGTSNFDMLISPQVILNIDGEERAVKTGDFLYSEGNNRVYVGYVGTEGDTTSSEGLYVYFLSAPAIKDNKLSDEKISSINSLAQDLSASGQKSTQFIDSALLSGEQALKSFGGAFNMLFRFIESGESFYRLNFPDKSQTIFGKSISIIGVTGAQDAKLNNQLQEMYENAKKDYETIRNQFSSEEYPGSTYGEEALYKEIMLALNSNQKATAIELCTKFFQDYPNSNRKIEECNNVYKLANQDAGEYYVTIGGKIKKLSFDGIYEPGFEDYGAQVVVSNTQTGKPVLFNLRRDEKVMLNGSGINYIQLISLDETSATVKSNLIQSNVLQSASVNVQKLEKDITIKAGNYSITLTKINLKKLAKVSVISNINNAGTSANFSFKIGIEKRAISLPPEKVREMITDLDEQIKTWKGFSDSLGGVVETLKTSCLVAGVALVAKNFLANAGTSGLARKDVMRGKSGWYEKCTDLVSKQTYSTQDECYSKNAEQIDKDVEKLSSIMDKQNSEIKTMQEGITTSQFLSENAVNTSAFMERYAPQATDYIDKNLPLSITDPNGIGGAVNKSDVLSYLSYDSWKSNKYSSDDLREIELYTKVLNDESASEDLKKIARETLYSDFSDVKTTAANFVQASTWANNLNVGSDKISSLETQKDVKKMAYNGLTNANLGSKKISGISDNTPVALVQTFPDGKQYIVVLDDSAGTSKLPIKNLDNSGLAIYKSSGELVSNPPSDLINVYFERFDSSSYTNQYKNAKLRYYETEPYKGMPAVVPFDTNNGWYAATKQTLATGGSGTYDASGRVNSFYLCNVGKNGLEEFQTIGDDICQMINTGTGMPYNQFSGLSEIEAKKIIDKAVKAIQEAAKLYSSGLSGKVKILDSVVEVGSPAVDVPEYSCQDYMSPKDCLLLFNLCDPVICPSSRCNLGGAYPVEDVVQSGIIGSIALCLPNFKEGIIMPVCLTGVKAGIDSFLSIEQAYRDCLNESLETGSMVGICDEIYSIYLCDFFWRQAIPLAQIFIPKMIEFISGQNVRGGGEYLSVASAWSGAETAVNYFVNSYGVNAKAAFLARSTSIEDIGGEVCKVYTSMVVPSGGDLLSKLTKADSPSQFTGRFDEIPLTTATVPPTSHYKVYYHIYAGQDSGAYYKVYLKGSPESSYYKDTAQTVIVPDSSGYIAVGGYADETKDFIATSGYKQLCINVNGQEECGFAAVSTSFAVNYIKDEYLKSQATEQITKESECISDSSSGIIRICATDNPGKGTDAQIETKESRWQDVGYCDKEEMKCWIDTDSIKDTIRTTTVEGQTLDEVSNNYVNKLINESNYLSEDEFSAAFQNIEKENASAKITLTSNVLEKVFWSSQKAKLLITRGNAYAELLGVLVSKQPKPQSTITSTTGTTGETTTSTDVTGAVTGGSGGESIWQAAKNLVDSKYDEKRAAAGCKNDYYCIYDNVCIRFVVHAMVNAGVKDLMSENQDACVQSACTIQNGKMVFDTNSRFAWESINATINQLFTVSKNFAEITDFNSMQKGDLIILGYGAKQIQHIVIFDSYSADKKTFDAFGDPGVGCTGTWVNAKCVGITFIKTSMIEHYPIKTSVWFVHRVFRYMGEGQLSSQPIISGTGVIPAEGGAETGEATVTPPVKETVAYKIFREASDRAYKTKDESFKFVVNSVNGAGVAFPAGSLSNFISSIKSDSNFAEVNLGVGGKGSTISFSQKGISQEMDAINRLETGDIVLIGKGCNKDFAVGIYHSTSNKIYFFSNMGNGVELIGIPISSGLGLNNDAYIHGAYKYIGDLGEAEKNSLKSDTRTRWTIDSALAEISKHQGNYNDNKAFFDSIIFDGLLTEKECNEIGRDNFLALGQKDIRWLNDILVQKKSSSG